MTDEPKQITLSASASHLQRTLEFYKNEALLTAISLENAQNAIIMLQKEIEILKNDGRKK